MEIKRIRSARGCEYEAGAFISFVQSLGIIHETTPPYSLASNGVAKRKNRTLIVLTNAMLIESCALLHFWGEGILTTCNVLNRVPHIYIYIYKHSTPFEMLLCLCKAYWP